MRVRIEHAGAPYLAVNIEAGERAEAFVGEATKLRVPHAALAATIEVIAGALDESPTIEGNVVTFARPGVYRLRVTCGELSGDVELGVLPAEALEHFTLADVRTGPDRGTSRTMRERRLVCRSLVRDSSAAASLDALTPARPLPAVNLSLFGA